LFVNLVSDDLDSIVDESFPTLDRDDCIAALERGAVLVAEAGLLTREEAQLMFGLLASKWHISLDGFLAEYPEFNRDRCVAALRYAGAALAAEVEFEQQADRLDAAASLAVRILRRTGLGGGFAIALCSEAETEADVYRWLAISSAGMPWPGPPAGRSPECPTMSIPPTRSASSPAWNPGPRASWSASSLNTGGRASTGWVPCPSRSGAMPWGAERLGVEGVLWPDRVRLIARALPPGGRIALPVEDLSDRETDPTIPPPGDNPQGLATFDPMEHPSYRTAARTFLDGYLQSRGIAPCEWPEDQGAADVVGEARYSVEDGPGSGTRVELSVSVLVGTERSTVFVVDPLTGRALARELVHHGGEAGAAAVAVSAALRRCLPGAPGGVAGGSREAAGEPIE
jgi:hypothetical protein